MNDAYCDLVNLIDDIALENRAATEEEMQTIQSLAAECKIEVIDFADANGCGYQDNWNDVIKEFAELHKNGKRVAV